MSSWPYPRVFSHRCGGALAPENTLEGLDFAARYRVGVEFDVMLSKDGTPYLIHDETLERTTSGAGRVAETGDAVLDTLDAGVGFVPRGSRVRLPRLVEAAARCIELSLAANIEIKPSAGAEAATGAVVAQLAGELWQGVAIPPLLSSFSPVALEAAREAAPALPRGLLVKRLPDGWLRLCGRLGVIAVHVNSRRITRTQVAAVHAAGLRVVIYTENDATRAARFFEWGADCIITDRPDHVPGAGNPPPREHS